MKKINSSSIIINPTNLQLGAATDNSEDRSAYLRSNSPVTWTGTQLTFTTDIILEIINTVSGTTTTHTVLTAGSPITINNGESVYISIDRTISENVSAVRSSITPVPAQSSANRNVFVLFKRVDFGGIAYLHLPFSRQVLNQGQTVRLGASGSGSGGGANAVNLVGLDTNFQPVNSDDINAENTVGNWLAYADAPGVAPVDMTGGSPVVTITRTTTVGQVLDGGASFLITKDAANRQGQGVSVLTNIPLGFRGTTAMIQVPFKVISGTLVSGDLKMYIYDVTNGVVITPFNNDVVGTQGILTALFSIPTNCTQIRFGFHFASTSTTALTMSFDDVFIGASSASAAIGAAVGDWQNDLVFTPNAASNGAISATDYRYRRVGDTMEVLGRYETGSVTGTAFSLQLPSGYFIDTTKMSSNPKGEWVRGFLATTSGVQFSQGGGTGASNAPVLLFYDGSTNDQIFVCRTPSAGSFVKESINITAGNGQEIYFWFSIPIAGWSSNVSVSQSSTFNVSSFLANGTRVTSLPANLGEYRTYKKDAGATTGTDEAPSTPPSAVNGMLIYSVNYASAGASGQTNRWEIFIGKNKNFTLMPFKSTGHAGPIDIDVYYVDNATTIGLFKEYDPTTGVLIIDSIGQNTTTTTRQVATDIAAGGATGIASLSSCYFDVRISENALAVGIQFPRSEVFVNGGNGHGSTDTFIRRFTNLVSQTGSAISYVQNASNGSKFLINEDGIYALGYTDASATGASAAITRNSPFLTTAESDASNDPYRLGAVSVSGAGTNQPGFVGSTLFLAAGDVIRAHNDSTTTPDNTAVNGTAFRITKISN